MKFSILLPYGRNALVDLRLESRLAAVAPAKEVKEKQSRSSEKEGSRFSRPRSRISITVG